MKSCNGLALFGALALVVSLASAADYPSIEIEGNSGGAKQGSGAEQTQATKVAVEGRYLPQYGEEKSFTAERDFVPGERATVFADTYQVRYIEAMEPTANGEQPVYANVRFGRWLDLTVTGGAEEALSVLVHYVRKEPVDGPVGDEPQVALPQGSYRIVSREVELPQNGEPVTLHVEDSDGELEVSLRRPTA